jgi:hypothetical protein
MNKCGWRVFRLRVGQIRLPCWAVDLIQCIYDAEVVGMEDTELSSSYTSLGLVIIRGEGSGLPAGLGLDVGMVLPSD